MEDEEGNIELIEKKIEIIEKIGGERYGKIKEEKEEEDE